MSEPTVGTPAGEDEPVLDCWCGESGPWSEMFDDAGLEHGCGGTGEIVCLCGGDFCVCHHHGGINCDGCDDCDPWGEP